MSNEADEDPPPLAPLTEEDTQRTFQQIMEVWVGPEIERRRNAGTLPPNFQFWMAQVIFEVDAPASVRLNEEVSAMMKARATRDVAKGEAVSVSDFSEIVSIELTDKDPNAGHITLMLHQDSWFITWDTRYNAGRIAQVIATADEFMASSRSALEANHARAFVDNLFSAVELMARAELLALPDQQVLKAKTHSLIHGRFNRWSAWGNVEPDFARLLNELRDMRRAARYEFQPWTIAPAAEQSLLARAEEMRAAVKARAPKRRATRDLK